MRHRNFRLFWAGESISEVGNSVTIVVTLMLGIGATTAVFSVVDRILFRPLPYAHADVDIGQLDKLPTLSPASGLSDAIVLSSPGVVGDSNGFFHPLGDHAQTSFSIDGQPIATAPKELERSEPCSEVMCVSVRPVWSASLRP